jgi:hypothetical protein
MVSEFISAVTRPFSAGLGHCARCTRSAFLLAIFVWSLTLIASMAGRTVAGISLGVLAAGLTMLWVVHLIGAMYHSVVNVILVEYGATRAEAKSITSALDLVLARRGRDCRRMAEGESLHVRLERPAGRRQRLMQVSITNKKECVAAVFLKEDGTYAEWRPSPREVN